MNNIEIGKFIKQLLRKNNMTNRDLIYELEKRHISMSDANMSNFLNGKHGTNVENYMEIARIFGITVDELLNAKLSDKELSHCSVGSKNDLILKQFDNKLVSTLKLCGLGVFLFKDLLIIRRREKIL